MQQSILVVDDDPDDCQLLAEVLLEVGWEGSTYFRHDGASALFMLGNLFKAGKLPSLIILDINLPGITGMDVLKTTKLLYPNIPVLMYSTTCTPEVLQEARENGAIDCYTKATSHAQQLEFGRHVLAMISQQ